MAFRHAERTVDLAADGADGAIADNGEMGQDIHSRQEFSSGVAGAIDALVGEAEACDGGAMEERSADRR